jgi:RNA polymerase sigma factor (sigma-70 family)
MQDADAEARLDATLVTRSLASDDGAARAAFSHLLRRHQGLVRAQLRRLCNGDDAWADDLAQECFLQAWRKLEQFRFESKFSTWLYRIAYTCFLQSHRAKPPEEMAMPDDLALHEASEEQNHGLVIDLQKAMAQLAVGERDAIMHCYHMDLSHEEAAQVLAMPLGTVKSHIQRGKEKLRALLG